MSKLLAILLLTLSLPALAAVEVEGVKFEDGVKVGAGDTALKPRIDQFRKNMLSIGTAPEKSVVNLDWLPDSGTRLSFNGSAKGSDIPGEDFYSALLRIWIGEDPAQGDLKNLLLGAPAN